MSSHLVAPRGLTAIRSSACLVALLAALASFSCDSPTPAEDAGAPDAGAVDAFVAECTSDAMCDDGLFCTGIEACEGGRCVTRDAVDCDDGVECTEDSCDEAAGMCVNTPPDLDEDGQADAACLALDGVPLGTDCDDSDANRFVGNVERCDVGHRDEDCDPSTFGVVDADGDGFPAARCCNEQPDGSFGCGADCDDTRGAVQPDSPEVCNGLDDDCDGEVDEGVALEGFVDDDHDGFGGATPRTACAGAVGFSTQGGDCDDGDPTRRPGQLELCDGRDNDCDPNTDEDSGPITWYRDLDGDLFGSAASGTVEDCADRRPEYSILDTDCNDDPDGGAGVNPAQAETCNGIDDDCNGLADFRIGVNDFEDDDGDGSVDLACGPPLGEDCDDSDPVTGAGSAEICDGRDNDCDENVDEGATGSVWYRDLDGDGWGSERSGAMISCESVPGHVSRAGDCNDASVDVSPDAAEICDGLDNDCNGSADDGAAFTSCSLSNASSACAGGGCRVETCLDGFDNCDGMHANGCELATGSPSACGCAQTDCGMAANVDSASCARPAPGLPFACVIPPGGCAADYGDCDGFASTGCETPTDRSTSHCGACNNVCANMAGATPVCLSGTCLGQCVPGRLNCGGADDGCESSASSVNTCGDCSTDCAASLPANVSTAADVQCATGTSGNFCRVASGGCDAGFGDCNGSFADGCEVDTRTHPAHCGGCNVTCFGEDRECIDGACVTSCGSGRLDCDAGIPGCEVNTFSDPMRRCGDCATSCVANQVCEGAACVCPPDARDCDMNLGTGCEVNVSGDRNNCGDCGVACTANEHCLGGDCVVCSANQLDCDGFSGCEVNRLTDPNNCGACGTVCGNGRSCSGGSCVCSPGQLDCGGGLDCETDSLNDPFNCGACNNRCDPGEYCETGVCTCFPGFEDCDGLAATGCESDTRTDASNCGGCASAGGADCGGGGVCTDGLCESCPGNTADCDGDGGNGCEVSLGTIDDCGSCGDQCSFDQSCNGSVCQCPAGQLDCDTNPGCEAFEYDPMTCLGCGTVCNPGEWCAMAGGCTACAEPMTADCNQNGFDGCETSIGDDINNCGGCGQFCDGGQQCSEGTCCAVGQGDCDGNGSCTDDLDNDPNNCGGCGISCGPGGVCSLGTCDRVREVHTGQTTSCALRDAGGIFCWGDDSLGQFGDGVANNSGGFGGPGFTQPALALAVGAAHACAILSDRTVWCWGNSSEGELGDNTNSSSSSPVQVSTVNGWNGLAWAIAAGFSHTCLIEFSAGPGRPWCWGGGDEGQLGDGTSLDAFAPVDASNSGAYASMDLLAVGGDFSCAVDRDSFPNLLTCWGIDTTGQLGNGPGVTHRPLPLDSIEIPDAVHLMAGHHHACIVDSMQNVSCWGRNQLLQLGNGNPAATHSPSFVNGSAEGLGGSEFATGWIVPFSNNVRGVGDDSQGQLGDGTPTASHGSPVGPSGAFFNLSQGSDARHTCAVDNLGRVWCWGRNNERQVLGSSTASPQPTPMLVPFPWQP